MAGADDADVVLQRQALDEVVCVFRGREFRAFGAAVVDGGAVVGVVVAAAAGEDDGVGAFVALAEDACGRCQCGWVYCCRGGNVPPWAAPWTPSRTVQIWNGHHWPSTRSPSP